MKDQSIWSIGLGRWAGLQVRVHMFFLLFAVFTLYMSWSDPSGEQDFFWHGPALLALLFLSVLLHELGHIFIGNRLGAQMDRVVIGPLGGLGPRFAVLEPPAELVTSMAGPLTNLGLCLASAIVLAVNKNTELAGLLNLVSPKGLGEPLSFLLTVKMVFWVNWLLFVLNLIPAFPFDGGRAIRAAVLTGWPQLGSRSAIEFCSRLAKVIAVAFLVAAVLLCVRGATTGSGTVPTWIPLALLSIFVYFSARKEETEPDVETTEDSFLGYDFSEGYTSLERSHRPVTAKTEIESESVANWWQRRREQRVRKQEELEELEDSRVDEILEQVHLNGLESLSSEDRDLLNRASRRYQDRRLS